MKAVVFQRLQATEGKMLRMISGVTLKDMVESTVIASRVGVNDLEEHLWQKRLRWFGHIVRRDEKVEIKKILDLKIGQRKRGRPVKRWIDMVEVDIKKEGNSATGCRGQERLEKESGERTGQPPLVRKIRQDNKLMMMIKVNGHNQISGHEWLHADFWTLN